ncbi:unnamed protein product [Ectocarpus sp. CCAP 1310/34]|nr:unnamed protein product [Ectocarpus sp. CCAP 1310/34]
MATFETKAETKTSDGHKVVGVVQRSKAKTVHFIRHAEGTHNEAALKEGRAAYAKIEHLDARLTDLGKQQCATLKATKHGVEKEAQLVVVSPLTRAIQTAMLTIDQVEGVPWVALECVRERAGAHPCDRRRCVSELKQEYPDISFDEIKDEKDVYFDSLGEEREPNDLMADRGRELLSWLKERPETNIVVVTHSAFLLCLFNEAMQAAPETAKWFENCELRSVFLEL